MSFCTNLQYLRKLNKITQEELAEKLEVSRQSVSKWETGEAYPETEKIIALCDIFGVDMDSLMRGDVTSARTVFNAVNEEDGGVIHDDGVEEGAMPSGEESGGRSRAAASALGRAGRVLEGGIISGSVAAYIIMGAAGGLWHPGWLIFIFAVALCAFIDEAFAAEGGEHNSAPPAARIFYGLASMVIILSPGVYLVCGLVFGNWHPSWVVFIVAGFLMIALGGIGDALSGKSDD